MDSDKCIQPDEPCDKLITVFPPSDCRIAVKNITNQLELPTQVKTSCAVMIDTRTNDIQLATVEKCGIVASPASHSNITMGNHCPINIVMNACGISDAPLTGLIYGRRNKQWVAIPSCPSVQPPIIPPIPPTPDPGPGGNCNMILPTHSPLGGNRVMSTENGYAVYSDPNNIELPAIGLSIGAAEANKTVEIQMFSKMTISSAGFIPGKGIFVGPVGTLVQVPPTTGFIQRIGTAQTQEIIIIEISQPIYL